RAATKRPTNLEAMSRGAYLLDLGLVPYGEAWDLQRSLAGAVSQGAIPDVAIFLEHPPVVTLGRRTDSNELHVPEEAEVEIVETDRGGKSTFHGPGQLVCYPILDLKRHGKDVKKYVRDLEEALIETTAQLGVEATRIEGLTGVWLERPPRKIASIGVHISRWVTTHGYALNVDLDPAPFTEWITACGLEDAAFQILGDNCKRACRYCYVHSGRPDSPPDPLEPLRLANVAAQMELKHVVVTSVDRDDVPDRGAGHYAATIRALKKKLPGSSVEVLTPDFLDVEEQALQIVIGARPDVFSHNIETVRRLHARMRGAKASYDKALWLLQRAKEIADYPV